MKDQSCPMLASTYRRWPQGMTHSTASLSTVYSFITKSDVQTGNETATTDKAEGFSKYGPPE